MAQRAVAVLRADPVNGVIWFTQQVSSTFLSTVAHPGSGSRTFQRDSIGNFRICVVHRAGQLLQWRRLQRSFRVTSLPNESADPRFTQPIIHLAIYIDRNATPFVGVD